MIRSTYEKYIKKINIWFALFAMMFSAMLIISRHIFNLEAGISTIESVYVTDFHFVDLIAWIGVVPIVYILIKIAVFLCTAGETVFFQEERKGKRGVLVFSGSLVLLLLLWFPYLPSYWPGGIYSDTVDSINVALHKDVMDNHNPILYTLIWRFMFWVTGAFSGEGEYGGLKLFTVVQTLLMALALAYFIYWCYRWGIHKAFVLLCLLIFAMFSLYPFYGISLWKDTLFSLVVFIFSIFLYHILLGKSDSEENVSCGNISGINLTEYCLFSILIIFLRNNGIYVAAFYSVMITALCLKRKKMAMKIGIASLVILLISGIIQGPVYDQCGYNVNRATESFGIPLQQVAYIVSTDGIVMQEDREVIEQMMPIERWRELYNPLVVDTIKFSPEFDRYYLEEKSGEFIKMYLHLVLKNPVKAGKAYLLSTLGFWNICENSSTAYICDFHFGNAEYFMSDYFDYYLDISFRNFAEPKSYLSAAIFVWLLLGTIFICLWKRNFKGIAVLMPTFGVWLSIMAATPVAFSFRYVYALFLCTPLYLLVCVRSFRKEKVEMEEIFQEEKLELTDNGEQYKIK